MDTMTIIVRVPEIGPENRTADIAVTLPKWWYVTANPNKAIIHLLDRSLGSGHESAIQDYQVDMSHGGIRVTAIYPEDALTPVQRNNNYIRAVRFELHRWL